MSAGRMDRKHLYQPQGEDQRVDLEVVGRHALLFDDDSTAAFVNSSDALVPWSGGDASLLLDRFDARHLLQQFPVRGALKRQMQLGIILEPDGISRLDLDAERYRDLGNGGNEEDRPSFDAQQNEEIVINEAEPSSYRSVPFAYSTSSGYSNIEGDGLASSNYRPPFPVPQHLLNHLPPTEKVHQIISRTANFVSKHRGQTEIILRVKEAGNPTFGFLMPDHQLHPYFRYLVENPKLVEDKEKTPDIGENKLSDSGGALSLLGSVYGSAEDDGIPDTSEVREIVDKGTKPKLKELIEGTKASLKGSSFVKEKPLLAAKGSSSIVFPSGDAGSSKSNGAITGSIHSLAIKPVSDASKTLDLVVEPPPPLKPMIEKTAEFICRNGREFEASLILQDKMNDKFPFLRPSNLYHSYYLKILELTREGNLPCKSASDKSKSDAQDVDTPSEASSQHEKKDKLKATLGAGPKPPKPLGLSAEDTAAIVMAATRGIHARNQTAADAPNTSSIQVPDAIRRAIHVSNDSCKTDSSSVSDKQKLQAERLKRAKMFASMIKSGRLRGNDDSQINKREEGATKQRERDSQDNAKEGEHEQRSKRHSRHSKRYRRHRHEDSASDSDECHHRHRRSSSSSKREHDEDDNLNRERSSRSQRDHDYHQRRERSSSRDELAVPEGEGYRQLNSEARPLPATEVPDDLRAKIRAMLMETL